jgi:tRNA(Ile)-lysidine synthase
MGDIQGHGLEHRLIQAWPPQRWCDVNVVVGVSSGPDSVALLRAMRALKATYGGPGQLFVAHFNHLFRGAAADDDQAWLVELCRRLNVPLVTGRANPTDVFDQRGAGREEAARTARYRFLCQTAEHLGARFVAVAHTQDDQVETVLHRTFRGTGLEGLAGMPNHRPLSPSVTLVRPLLALSRREVLGYLADIGQDFRLDDTNSDTQWTRNRLRHELLPLLRRQYNTGVDNALLRLAAHAEEAQRVITGLSERLADECVTWELADSMDSSSGVARIRIECCRLAESPPLLVREACRIAWQRAEWPLQSMGHDQWQQLAELISGVRETQVNLPGNVRGRRETATLVLEAMGAKGACPHKH